MKPLVQRLGYVEVEAIDPEAVARDTINIAGPREVARTDTSIMLSSNSRHAEYIVTEGSQNAFRVCGLEAVSAEAVDEVERRTREAGLEIITREPSLDAIEKSVTFRTSEGLVFEVHTPMARDRAKRYAGPGSHPKCLDHVNFTAVDPKQWAEEMGRSCGLVLSERTTGYEISWMRGADNRHHTVAAVKSHAPGVHHLSWEFETFNDMKNLADTLIPESRPLVWGPGRHGAGDNLFLYYRDPSGFLVECIAEMEMMDADEPTRVSDPGEGLSNWKVVNQWGWTPPIEWIEWHTPISDTAAAPAAV